MNDERYTDGFLVPIARDKLDAYRQVAETCAAIWREHGAIEYVETVIDDDGVADLRSFAAAADAREGEVVVLAYVVYPSKAARDEANRKIMDDPRIRDLSAATAEIFDCRRMAFGGFRSLVRA